MRPQRGRFSNQADYVIWGRKGGMPLGRAAPSLPGMFREAVRKADKHRLTGKPTDLMRKLVRICEQGGHILCSFVGSGTSLVAANAEGYSWTGIEMTGRYFEVAGPRLPTPQRARITALHKPPWAAFLRARAALQGSARAGIDTLSSGWPPTWRLASSTSQMLKF